MEYSVFIPLVGHAATAAGVIYTIVASRKKASADALKEISTKVDGKADASVLKSTTERVEKVEVRITRVEDSVEHLPDRDATHRLELSLAEVRGEIKALTERLGPVTAVSNRLQEYLLEQAHDR